jgi:uncharacterized protein
MPSIETARSWYPPADPIHGFDHVLRVYLLAKKLARAEGADLEIVRAAVLLHDASSDQPSVHEQDTRQAHHLTSAAFAGKILLQEGWSPDQIRAVQHCIRAHRFRDDANQPETIEAKVVFDADKLDAIGAIGVARAIAYAVRAGQPVYAQPSGRFMSTGKTEPGEPHSANHEYIFKLGLLKDRLFTKSAQLIASERHQFMVNFFDILAAEERGEK